MRSVAVALGRMLLAALPLLAGAASLALAQETVGAPPEVRMDEVQIKGEVERPGVFYIIPRREVQLDLGRQSKDFSAELRQPLDPAAFEHWVRQQTHQPGR